MIKMFSKLTIFFVKRYLRFDKEQPFISLSAILAFIGIALGVMVLIIAMAIMNGFDKEFETRLSIMNYPLTIISNKNDFVSKNILQLVKNKFPDLKYSPFLLSNIIVKHGNKMEGGVLFGVNFDKENQINSILQEATKDLKIGKFEVIVGKSLYYNMFLDNNSKLTYIFTKISPLGLTSTPKMKRFKVKGFFNSKLNSYDLTFNFTNIESLRKIIRIKKDFFHGIHIYSENPLQDIKKIKAILPKDIIIIGWWQQNGNFFSALQMEKRALFIVLMLIILIASVNIISSLLMTVMNRRNEIALLLSFGATIKEIKYIFLSIGIVIGIGGIIIGVLLGFSGLFILGNFDIISLPADVYGTSQLPLDLSMIDLFSVLIGAFIIVILSALYPAIKASKIDILQVLRNE